MHENKRKKNKTNQEKNKILSSNELLKLDKEKNHIKMIVYSGKECDG